MEEVMIKCEVCNREFDRITWSHLGFEHSMTLADYFGRFPGISLDSPELTSRLCEANQEAAKTRSLLDEVTKRAMSESAKARWADPEKRADLLRARRETLDDPGYRIYRSNLAKEIWARTGYKDRLSGIHSRLFKDNPALGDELIRFLKVKWEDPEFRLFKSSRQKELWADPNWRDKTITAMVKGRKRRPTEPEFVLLMLLDKNFPGEWKYNGIWEHDLNNTVVVIGGKVPDFIRTDGVRKVIEVFGYYWHPDLDEEEEKVAHYSKYGYNCLVLWDDEIYGEAYIVKRVSQLGEYLQR